MFNKLKRFVPFTATTVTALMVALAVMLAPMSAFASPKPAKTHHSAPAAAAHAKKAPAVKPHKKAKHHAKKKHAKAKKHHKAHAKPAHKAPHKK